MLLVFDNFPIFNPKHGLSLILCITWEAKEEVFKLSRLPPRLWCWTWKHTHTVRVNLPEKLPLRLKSWEVSTVFGVSEGGRGVPLGNTFVKTRRADFHGGILAPTSMILVLVHPTSNYLIHYYVPSYLNFNARSNLNNRITFQMFFECRYQLKTLQIIIR